MLARIRPPGTFRLLHHSPKRLRSADVNISFVSNVLLGRHKSTASPEITKPISPSSQKEASIPLEKVGKTLTCQSPPMTGRRRTKAIPFYAPYLALTKPRLTALVVLSAMGSYALTPYHATLPQLLFLTAGTTLCSSSANAINMGREHEYDAMMTRTRNRPVVRGQLSPKQAFAFAAVSGTVGVGSLFFGVNPTVALLGASNILLYGGIYTSMKRTSILNTWVGAIVGAIPPLMGWAASGSLMEPGGWLLAGILYAWQFPHFNSLSHNIRDEYRRAGYQMAAWTNPALNARVALRYSVLMFPLCIGLAYYGITDWVFPFDSGLLTCWLTYEAYYFWRDQRLEKGPVYESTGPNPSARRLFWGSVWYLPGVLVLAMLHKKGRWDWLFGSGELDP
uniref:Protoheme IX farnesyltransferase, mitochondrial n=1 Tax=Blastobotrys adeninivorans TaxID=409370 RepID=A0A060T4H2_BLAAD